METSDEKNEKANDKALAAPKAQRAMAAIGASAKELAASFIGAIEKGIKRAKLSQVTVKTNLDLTAVPNYVAYKAALIREKMNLQYLCAGLLAAAVAIFISQRLEIAGLETKLRTKEFILAPGVSDFIPVAPQTVPDSYVQHAVSDFVATLGNTTPLNIEERFKQLSSLMSPALQVRFNTEAREWVEKARTENISELVTILEKKIEATSDGRYRATARIRTDSFIGVESIGFRNEVVTMDLRLVAPEISRRWYLEITALSRESTEAYESRKSMEDSTHGK